MATRPPSELLAAWPSLARQLAAFELVTDRAASGLPLTLTSWYRDPAENARVRGAADSQHLFGLARDYAGAPAALAILAERLNRLGLTVVDEGDHVHVQAFAAGTLARCGVRFPTIA